MINWFIANKEWVFSGVGVALAGVVISLLRRLWPKRKDRLPEKIGTRPSPAEIRDVLAAAPSLHQDMRAAEYVGLSVDWLVTLESATRKEDGTVRLMLRDRGDYPWVNCTILLSDYPHLLLVTAGAKFWITGKIDAVSNATIELADVHLSLAS